MYNYTSGQRESMASEEPSPSPSPFSLAFPPEIWSIVLHSFGTQPQDLVELWMTCRGVCQCFKHVVEGIFIADTLPHISLRFDITTSQGFERNSRIEFRDYQVQTAYNCASADRTRAFFQAKDDNGAVLLKEMHDGAGSSWPSHLVDLSRPSGEVAFPGIFFHANGIVEVGWRDLFAAILAEENYYYRTNGTPAHLRVSQIPPLKAFN